MSNNLYFIDKYKDFDSIIKTYYKSSISNNIIDGIVVPNKIDNRQLCSVPENQGSKPHCAGYSCGNYWEALYWKRTGKLINLDSDQIYANAKLIDGNIASDGTYLEASQQACAKLCGVNDKIKLGFLYNDRTNNTIIKMKRLLHMYDICQIGCNITTKWYEANKDNPIIQHGNTSLGGHAIIACGYDSDGLYIQNSWGKNWGNKSFAILTWDAFIKEFMYACYIENLFDLSFNIK